MKCIVLRITFTVLVILLLSVAVSAAAVYSYGDANADGAINLKDVTALKRMLVSSDVDMSAVEGNPDVNGDGTVNLKDVTLLQRYLAGGWGVTLPEQAQNVLGSDLANYEVMSTSTNKSNVVCTSFRFGTSVLGRELVCWSIHPEAYSRTVLLNFEIHGWEDEYAADGQILVDLGNALVAHYAQSTDLQGCRLLIIPSANPDGLAEGTTNNGFGRCNADGIDLNRDFDASHVVYTTARNYTPAPFTVPSTVTSIEAWCFARSALKEIIFKGNAPTIGTGAFNKITLTAYYPKGNTTWTASIMLSYGGTVTWTTQ